MVDLGAERTCVTTLPQGGTLSQKNTTVIGAKGVCVKVSIIEQLRIKGNGQTVWADIILVLEAEFSLSGSQLGIGVVLEDGSVEIKHFILTKRDKQEIAPHVWAGEENRGVLQMAPTEIELKEGGHVSES